MLVSYIESVSFLRLVNGRAYMYVFLLNWDQTVQASTEARRFTNVMVSSPIDYTYMLRRIVNII